MVLRFTNAKFWGERPAFPGRREARKGGQAAGQGKQGLDNGFLIGVLELAAVGNRSNFQG